MNMRPVHAQSVHTVILLNLSHFTNPGPIERSSQHAGCKNDKTGESPLSGQPELDQLIPGLHVVTYGGYLCTIDR